MDVTIIAGGFLLRSWRMPAAWRGGLLGVIAGASLSLCACGGSESGPEQQAAALTYCDVAGILESKCQRCHASPPVHGAPFPLMNYDDTQQPAPVSSDPGRKRTADMLEAVESNFMPYMRLSLDPPVSPLTCEERTTLLTWLRKGASPAAPGHEDCSGVNVVLLSCAD